MLRLEKDLLKRKGNCCQKGEQDFQNLLFREQIMDIFLSMQIATWIFL